MKILIIDDEKVSRKVLLSQFAGIADCTAVDDSKKGMSLIIKAIREKKPFDLVTMDISMPKFNGVQLLKAVRQKEKELKIDKADRTKIIMVTSRMNISTIKECIRFGCNSYLSKPVNRYQLLDALGKMGFSQLPAVQNQKQRAQSGIVADIIKRFYAGGITLPILPGIVNEVDALMKKSDPSIDDLAQIVKKDILISTKIISIANSPLYRGLEKTDNLNAALVRLGLKAATGLVTSIVAKDMFKSENETVNTHLDQLWRHSFACACFAKRLGEEMKNKNADSLFLMGIIHDIGKMLLIKAVADIHPKEVFDDDMQVAIHEIHTTFGAVFLKRMRFTKEFVHIAEFHHWKDFSNIDDQDLIIITLSDELADKCGYTFFNPYQKQQELPQDAPFDLEGIKAIQFLDLDKGRLEEIAIEMRPVIKAGMSDF